MKMDSFAGEAETVDVIGVAPKCFNGDRESKEDAAVEEKCRHMTHKYFHLHVHICLQLAWVCAPATDHDHCCLLSSRPASEKKTRIIPYHSDMVAERGCCAMADRESRRAVGVEQEEAKGNEQEVVKVESELQKTGGGIIAPMNKNLVPLASAGESKVFYYKMGVDCHRYLAEFATGDAKQVDEDVMGWTVVTRNKKQKMRTVQIFVKVDDSKIFPLDVSPDDKVYDVTKQIQTDEDVYVTMYGRVLKRSEKLRSCGVTDGCTVQVTSRVRVGGRHEEKRSKAGKKRNRDESGQQDQHVGSVSDKSPEMLQSEKDGVIQML